MTKRSDHRAVAIAVLSVAALQLGSAAAVSVLQPQEDARAQPNALSSSHGTWHGPESQQSDAVTTNDLHRLRLNKLRLPRPRC